MASFDRWLIQRRKPPSINTTGRSTVSEIVDMFRFIAEHLQPILAAVFRLFQSFIKA
jgi:hypothetical protein